MARIDKEQFYRSYDVNHDNVIDKAEFDNADRAYSSSSDTFLFNGKEFRNWQEFKNAMKAYIVDHGINIKPNEAGAKELKSLTGAVTQDHTTVKLLKDQIEKQKQELAKNNSNENQARLKTMQAQLQAVTERLRSNLIKTQSLANALGAKDALKSEWFKEAGLKEPGETIGNLNVPLKGAAVSKGLGSNMNLGKAISDASSFSPPASWGSQFGPKSADFNLSSIMQDLNLEALDNVFKTQQDGDKLMRLFYYYARMAASGDMGAMYEFMKFITYIISKDKAKQQIEMGKKLIKLQSDARKWTSELLAMDSSKSGDEFSKKMMEVKSETDSIATSQKLIAQMMEEMAQVVETMTNATKSALDAHGRILRVVSRMG